MTRGGGCYRKRYGFRVGVRFGILLLQTIAENYVANKLSRLLQKELWTSLVPRRLDVYQTQWVSCCIVGTGCMCAN